MKILSRPLHVPIRHPAGSWAILVAIRYGFCDIGRMLCHLVMSEIRNAAQRGARQEALSSVPSFYGNRLPVVMSLFNLYPRRSRHLRLSS